MEGYEEGESVIQLDLIKELLSMTEEVETPASFIRYAGYCAISAILKRNVWLDKFAYKLYPNIYVLLIADSGKAKGFSNVIASRLVESVNNTRLISGRNSIQGILKELSIATTSPNGGPPALESTCFLNSGEFVNFLLKDEQSISILTELYDSNYITKYTSTFRSTGKETLKEPYVVLLGSSNETLLREALPDSATEGGFIARTILVKEDKKRTINPLTRAPVKKVDTDSLAPYLKEVAKLRGEFSWTNAARDFYEKWYREFAERDLSDRTGSSNRLHDTLLKMSIIISVSKRLDQKLELSDLQEAYDELIITKSKEKGIFLGPAVKTDWALKTKSVLKYIVDKEKISRIRILQHLYGIVNAEDLDKIIENLTQVKYVRTTKIDKEVFYEITEIVKEKLLE